MSETCERCYRELEPGDEKFCKWCRRYNVVSDEAWLLRRQLADAVADRDALRKALQTILADENLPCPICDATWEFMQDNDDGTVTMYQDHADDCPARVKRPAADAALADGDAAE